ncbi:jg6741 [Pararge aegeria aegeria]|uniref:Jg6741 protein n=1 Tax=Pararge aegeria aegeria TaxID=348720 RepID=A0A8S4R0R9_9NEOP|nr:jg6741 [Pararge aegeria aegeria]
MDFEVPNCWNGNPIQVNAALVYPQRSGQTISNQSLGAAGNKRPGIVDFEAPYKRPISRGGRQSVQAMMRKLMMMDQADGPPDAVLISGNTLVTPLVLQMFMGGGDHLTSGDPLGWLPAINIKKNIELLTVACKTFATPKI